MWPLCRGEAEAPMSSQAISKVRSETWRIKSLPKPPEVREIMVYFREII
jgi:hypothetical protein